MFSRKNMHVILAVFCSLGAIQLSKVGLFVIYVIAM